MTGYCTAIMPATHDHHIRGFLDGDTPDALDYFLLKSTNRAGDSECFREALALALNFPVFRNFSFSPTYTVFFMQAK